MFTLMKFSGVRFGTKKQVLRTSDNLESLLQMVPDGAKTKVDCDGLKIFQETMTEKYIVVENK